MVEDYSRQEQNNKYITKSRVSRNVKVASSGATLKNRIYLHASFLFLRLFLAL
jgi:hypothetical protein